MKKNPIRSAGIAAVFIAAACSACTSRHATYAPDGRRSYVITCDGFLNSYANCLVKAGRACKSLGYDVLKGSEDDRNMLVACKTTSAKVAN